MHNEGAAQAEQFARNSPTYWSASASPFYCLEIYECHLIVPPAPCASGFGKCQTQKEVELAS